MLQKTLLLLSTLILSISHGIMTADDFVPTLEQTFELNTVNDVIMSPDGLRIAYTVQQLDFEADQYLNQLWVLDIKSKKQWQLTYAKKTVSGVQWSSDSNWLLFKRDKKLLAIHPDGGEAKDIGVDIKDIGNYQLSQDMRQLFFISGEDRKKELKQRKDSYGDFLVVNEEAVDRHLFRVSLTKDMTADGKPEQITTADNFSISDMAVSPDGKTVVVTAAPSPRLVDLLKIDLYTVDVTKKEVSPLVNMDGYEGNVTFSPDGSQLAFNNSRGFQKNSIIYVVDLSDGQVKPLSESFDENASIIAWNKQGIFFAASQKTRRYLYNLNPKSSKIKRVSRSNELIGFRFSLSANGKSFAYRASSDTTLSEIFSQKGKQITKHTDMSEQIKDFALASRELIQWKADDGAEIEGVLIKPNDFDSNKKYPLYVVTHGGPTGTDRTDLSRLGRWYPVDIWAGKGALILKTNYRGSAGYGEAFRSLNWRNLGVGPATDIIAGINYLDELGIIDTSKVGCLGWSQGGHISAMLATYSDVCVAANMGAGISNWETYYYNTDITQFTVQYFGKTPLQDKQVYEKTSPMTYLNNAKTPVLIQHGENDKRVPIANAYELRQGLIDKGVDTTFLLYKGMPHGPRKPKTLRAVLTHVTEWFDHYLFDNAAPNYVNPALTNTDEPEQDSAPCKVDQ